MNRIKFILLLVIAALLQSCNQKTTEEQKNELKGIIENSATNGVDDAKRYVDDFHRKVDDQHLDEIYRESSDTLKNSVKEDEFVGSLESIFKKTGQYKKSEIKKINYQTANGKPKLELIYFSEYANNMLMETFTFDVVQNKVTLIGYHYSFLKPAS